MKRSEIIRLFPDVNPSTISLLPVPDHFHEGIMITDAQGVVLYMEGIAVTEETLALDVIHQVGPGGHYLQDSHTMEHFKEIKYSEIFDRSVYAQWETTGSKSFEQRLQNATLEKMKHRPEPIPENTIKTLDEMQESWK